MLKYFLSNYNILDMSHILSQAQHKVLSSTRNNAVGLLAPFCAACGNSTHFEIGLIPFHCLIKCVLIG